MKLCLVAHLSVIKIRMGAISSAVSSASDCTNSNFDERIEQLNRVAFILKSLLEKYHLYEQVLSDNNKMLQNCTS